MVKAQAQTTINLEGTEVDSSALLEVSSNTKGFLMPRMAENDRLSIGTPATGLFLFQTDNTPGYQYNSGTPAMPDWVSINLEETDSTYFDKRIPLDSVGNGQVPFTISESGSYYFTQNYELATGNLLDGITVTANHVTIDLNGYTLSADPDTNTDDGIFISGNRRNIVIQNGNISGWGDTGINALDADESIFRNLQLSDNSFSGLDCGLNGLISKCQAINNGQDGFSVDDGTIIEESCAAENGDNGFQTSEGSVIIGCYSFENIGDGFELAAGSRIEDCTAYENEEHGFDIGQGVQAIDCKSHDNGRNGFDMSSSALLLRCKASHNGFCINDSNCENGPSTLTASGLAFFGNGARGETNCQVINCTFADNDLTGIRIDGTDCYVAGNLCIANNNLGIYGAASGDLIVNNICNSNGSSPNSNFTESAIVLTGNYNISINSAFGPIINVEDVGEISGTANSDHPFANFEY